MVLPESAAVVTATLAKYRDARSPGARLMTILREVQEACGWLSPETLSAIARGIGWSRAEVEATAEFYSFFHTRPMGRYRVLWSDNITDRMAGSVALRERLCKGLWLECGHVSEDALVSVDVTSCIGMGDQAPALLINGRPLTAMTAARVDAMIELIRSETPLANWPREWFAVAANIRRKGLLLDNALQPGDALRSALARGAQGIVDEVERANLRGRGGAGFPTARKWRSAIAAPGQTRYLVCNADEGEPGTFKDRVLLEHYATLVFEGMSVAALALGAPLGLLYLRGEYRYLLEALEACLARRRAAGLLGANILGSGFSFDIEIHLGAGAYICGEESALIESLEGRPGRPRIRPPYPVTRGYLDQPTVVNNVETLACVCLIVHHGAPWYCAHGTAQSSGSKLISVSGDCARPGIYEVDFGTSISALLTECGAEDSQAVQVSGPSGICLGSDEFNRHIGFEDLPSAGALMVFDQRRDLFDMAHNFAHFFAHESCGFCTPCRVGTAVVARLLDKLAANLGSAYDIDELFAMQRLMTGTSHCGLGNSAGNSLRDTLLKFRPAFERRLSATDYVPAFDLDAALAKARQMTGRDDARAHLPRAS